MSKLIEYLKPHFSKMSLGLFIKFTGTIMDLLIPWFLTYLIDDIVPKKNVSLIFLWGAAMILCSIIAVLTNIIANRMASSVSRDTTEKLRHDLFLKISYLSCKQIDDFTLPSLISRLTTDTYHVHHMIGMMQRLGVRAPILLLGGILITLSLDPILTLVILATLPFIGGLVYFILKKGVPLYQNLQKKVDILVRTVREFISGIRIIKALSKTEYEKRKFSSVNNMVVKSEKNAGLTMAITNPFMNLFLNLGLVFVIIVGAYRVNSNLTQPGKIIAFLTYFTIILNAMMSISRIFINYSKGSASFKRISEVLEAPEDLILQEEDYVETEFHVSFENVSFSYNKNKDNLSNLSFDLLRGETLGIIGATGSGKTSIINLLMRFYDTDRGTIRIDGYNINCIPSEILHTKFGIVFQNDVLFADTIAENIDYGRGLSDDKIEFATSMAQAEEFIDTLPKRLDHELTIKGSNLSGGQKQRVLISRALADDPEVLILDDSSSALDYKTEAKLRKSLNKNFNDTTTIIVAQRISSIKHADHILVLDEGKSIGYGTHDELMNSCDIYREISRSQMGGDSV